MHHLVLAIVMVAALSSECLAGASHRRDQALPVIVEAPNETEGIGCYWERGREFCSRYCYIEVNGRRYCQERNHEAHSQAPVMLDSPVYAPMK